MLVLGSSPAPRSDIEGAPGERADRLARRRRRGAAVRRRHSDVVVSQYGHMFAPRPAVAIGEMLRVLAPGGTIAFSTWPAEMFIGRMFSLVASYVPPPPSGVSPPVEWGEPRLVRERLGEAVTDVTFERASIRRCGRLSTHWRTGASGSTWSTDGPLVPTCDGRRSSGRVHAPCKRTPRAGRTRRPYSESAPSHQRAGRTEGIPQRPARQSREALPVAASGGLRAERLEMLPDELVQHAGFGRPRPVTGGGQRHGGACEEPVPHEARQELRHKCVRAPPGCRNRTLPRAPRSQFLRGSHERSCGGLRSSTRRYAVVLRRLHQPGRSRDALLALQ